MVTKRARIGRRLNNFIKSESTGGLVMIFAAMLAMFIANSPFADWYQSFVTTPVSFGYGESMASEPLTVWVKDVLMVFFFLLVGMELKQEMLQGFLADRKQVLLPLLAAIGGMAAPAVVFLLINREIPQNLSGWAIPSATDIAFALCVLMLVGKSVPPTLKIFLLAIAIFDDLGAILIIALFYNANLSLLPILLAVGGAGALYALNRLRVMAILPYLAVGVLLWFFLHHGGIHTTIGGVMVGMAIPLRNDKDESNSPLNTCMHFLHPWVSFLILPVFAFTSAGIGLGGMALTSLLEPLPLGVALGLFIGKQFGIFGTSFLVIKSGLAALPEGVNWRQIYGVSIVAGIGFTMSLFIGLLAFNDVAMQDKVKLGVMCGSLLSAVCGWLVLKVASSKAVSG